MQIYSDKVFENPEKIIVAFDKDSFVSAFQELEKLKEKYYLVGYIRYDAKDIFLGKNIQSKCPLLYFEAFSDYKKFEQIENPREVFLFPKSKISFAEYKKGFEKIKDEISCGNTYEVNYTFDFQIDTEYSAQDIYNYFLTEQKTPYNAFIKNDYEEILSFSPELFFKKNGNKILTKPMKGTVERGQNELEDKEKIKFLRNDIKNRAENVMIVDLLRNDLGRISEVGSVKVPKLFEIETHKTLHQMTSEVTSTIKNNTTLYDIFKAIFPCGSITGAPKISTMSIIDNVEVGKRNVYCGAIGLIYKDCCEFSVPIRILQKIKDDNAYTYRAGGAVVWDSDVKNEWDEAILKTAFLSENSKTWKLIETLKVEGGKPILWKEHLTRIKYSAKKLDFRYNKNIENIVFPKDGMYRILLSKDGNYRVELKSLNNIKTDKIIISEKKVNSSDVFLYHKTTFRPYYNQSLEKIKNGEICDEIFFNEKGELTEGSRSNIVLNLDGNLYTPSIECGLLNGTFRQKMLKAGKCREKILYKEDLLNAQNIYCINSVRGMKEVHL